MVGYILKYTQKKKTQQVCWSFPSFLKAINAYTGSVPHLCILAFKVIHISIMTGSTLWQLKRFRAATIKVLNIFLDEDSIKQWGYPEIQSKDLDNNLKNDHFHLI